MSEKVDERDDGDLYNFSDQKWNKIGLPPIDKSADRIISPLAIDKDTMGWPSALEPDDEQKNAAPTDINPRAY